MIQAESKPGPNFCSVRFLSFGVVVCPAPWKENAGDLLGRKRAEGKEGRGGRDGIGNVDFLQQTDYLPKHS